ncbi:MAG: class I SAM-dependent methyltransferase [Syntrophorhabdaceae bacterium]
MRHTETKEELVNFGYERVTKQEKSRRVYRHFDNLALRYDAMNTIMSFGIHYLWKRQAVRELGLEPGESVLDVCGGTGDLCITALKDLGPKGKVILADINFAMMEAGKYKSTNKSLRRMVTHVGSDAEAMAFKSSSFDAVISGFGIRNLVHMEKGIAEIFRLLKPRGRFVCLEFSHPVSPWFRTIYDLYSFRVMPRISRIFLGSAQPFTYLSESIRVFPGPDRLSDTLAEAGFRNITYRLLTNGIAAIHRAEKPGATS